MATGTFILAVSPMSGAVAIFVKTPGRSPVKTRLAAGIGAEAAEAWYLMAAYAVAEVAQAAAAEQQCTAYWAVAEPQTAHDAPWHSLKTIFQGPGTLGERMHHVHNGLIEQHGSVVLLGADTPQLDVRELQETLAWLRRPEARAAIGPARDGGFWLFGSNRHIPLEAWTSVAYSSFDTRQSFVVALSACGFEWRTGPMLTDVDTVADLSRCHNELRSLRCAYPGQRALLQRTGAISS